MSPDAPVNPMQPSPIEIAVAVLLHQGCVLVGCRNDSLHAGYWEFPGGKVEPGELPRAAAERECREETGLEAAQMQFWREIKHHYPQRDVRLCFFRGVPADPKRTPHPPFRWVSCDALADYQFLEANAPIIAALCRGADCGGNTRPA